MESQKDRGAIDVGFGRRVRATKKKDQADEDVELIDADVNDFFEEGDAVDRRRDPLRDLFGK
jgi:hypothetical protein